MKINEENKVLMFFSSLSQSYDHIVTTMFYEKETFILNEVTTTLLSKKIMKRPNQKEQEGLSLVVTGRKRREKESPGLSKVCYFCDREVHWKKDYKHRQE